MIQYSYLLGLLFSIAGVLYIDYHWNLVWWRDAQRAFCTITIAWIFFIIWDLAGIGLEIFYPGNSIYMTQWRIGHTLPIEELIFLWFLAYQPLIIWEGYKRWKA